MKENEQVLVFPAKLLEGVEFVNNVLLENKAFALLDDILASKEAFYMDRKEAETNPNFKQIIPYSVLGYDDKFFVYQRTKKGGESRLHDLYSLGVGGHINPEDTNDVIDFNGYHRAMRRELAEEVAINSNYKFDIRGAIYDPSNEVGQVHFGVVHGIYFNRAPVLQFFDPALTNGEFHDRLWLHENKDKFENWSKLVIENIL